MSEQLSVYAVTWNVAGKNPTEDLRELLGLSGVKSGTPEFKKLPDFYAVGLQEVSSKPASMIKDMVYDDSWTQVFTETLEKFEYIKLKSIKLVGLLLLVFSKRKHLVYLRKIDTCWTRTGIGGTWGNKGAVSIRLQVYGILIIIVNTHLPPHTEGLQQRIADYNFIIEKHTYDDVRKDKILFQDYVVWLGDLNFRIVDFTGQEVEKLAATNNFEKLYKKDQLRMVQSDRSAFNDLKETMPNFPPTFKFHIGTDSYNFQRGPSWTDRILYRANTHGNHSLTLKMEQKDYKHHMVYKLSDHKPVSCILNFVAFVGKDEDRSIEFGKIKSWDANSKNSFEIRVPENVTTSNWDWVGLYRREYTSLKDYETYVYPGVITQPGPIDEVVGGSKTPSTGPFVSRSTGVSADIGQFGHLDNTKGKGRSAVIVYDLPKKESLKKIKLINGKMYTDRGSQTEKKYFIKTVEFPAVAPRHSDEYHLIYVDKVDNVLGISDPFPINKHSHAQKGLKDSKSDRGSRPPRRGSSAELHED